MCLLPLLFWFLWLPALAEEGWLRPDDAKARVWFQILNDRDRHKVMDMLLKEHPGVGADTTTKPKGVWLDGPEEILDPAASEAQRLLHTQQAVLPIREGLDPVTVAKLVEAKHPDVKVTLAFSLEVRGSAEHIEQVKEFLSEPPFIENGTAVVCVKFGDLAENDRRTISPSRRGEKKSELWYRVLKYDPVKPPLNVSLNLTREQTISKQLKMQLDEFPEFHTLVTPEGYRLEMKLRAFLLSKNKVHLTVKVGRKSPFWAGEELHWSKTEVVLHHGDSVLIGGSLLPGSLGANKGIEVRPLVFYGY